MKLINFELSRRERERESERESERERERFYISSINSIGKKGNCNRKLDLQ